MLAVMAWMMLDFAGVGNFALKPERTIVRNWPPKTKSCDARGVYYPSTAPQGAA